MNDIGDNKVMTVGFQKRPQFVLNLAGSKYLSLLGLCFFVVSIWLAYADEVAIKRIIFALAAGFCLLASIRLINQREIIFYSDFLVYRRLLGRDIVISYKNIDIRANRTLLKLISGQYATALNIGSVNQSGIYRWLNNVNLILAPSSIISQENIDRLLEILKEKAGVDLPDYYRTVGKK
jgi:hypothetical protein